jgi:hypothetical protein
LSHVTASSRSNFGFSDILPEAQAEALNGLNPPARVNVSHFGFPPLVLHAA